MTVPFKAVTQTQARLAETQAIVLAVRSTPLQYVRSSSLPCDSFRSTGMKEKASCFGCGLGVRVSGYSQGSNLDFR